MPKLLLVRHGEPAVKGVLLGRGDPGLSEAGRISAHRALGHIHGAVAYLSPLRRAQETAEFLPGAIPRVTVPELAEICLGDWEGLTWAEVEENWPDLSRRKLVQWFHVPAPGGETWGKILARAAAALQLIRTGPLPAIVVAHHGINSVLSAQVTGQDPHSFTQSYCEVIEHEI